MELMYPSQVVMRNVVMSGRHSGYSHLMEMAAAVLHAKKGIQQNRKHPKKSAKDQRQERYMLMLSISWRSRRENNLHVF